MHARRLSAAVGGAQIYLKREDTQSTGAHKINNVIGQALVAKRLGKNRLIAETGAGQHGDCYRNRSSSLWLKARILYGCARCRPQPPTNVFWMEQLGAEVIPVAAGSQTLKDAIIEALRDWSANVNDTHYVLGTACGPHPFPQMVAYFQSVIGWREVLQQCQSMGIIPTRLYACVGGGSNALGLFLPFVDHDNVDIFGVEAGGKGIASVSMPAEFWRPGIVRNYTRLSNIIFARRDGQMLDTHSVSAGLDYVGVSPIIAAFSESGGFLLPRLVMMKLLLQ